jgi:hypothetical protein
MALLDRLTCFVLLCKFALPAWVNRIPAVRLEFASR